MMDRMDMIWIILALEIYPKTNPTILVPNKTIKNKIKKTWGITISDTMINTHLVSWKARNADKDQPSRGGSRKRYVFKTKDGFSPNSRGEFRLYKQIDKEHDGWDKDGEKCPEIDEIKDSFPVTNISPETLIKWYLEKYYTS